MMYLKMAKESYQNSFVIRTYNFSELAQLYNPHIAKNSASFRLRSWINQSPTLAEKLNLKPFTRILTPNQVRMIVEHFDMPEKEITEN